MNSSRLMHMGQNTFYCKWDPIILNNSRNRYKIYFDPQNGSKYISL